MAAGEAFDVSPANIESRQRALVIAEGMKPVVLPKKTRGETVNLRVVLRFGNLEI